MKNKKMTILTAIYILVAIFIVALTCISITLAWYVKTDSKTLDVLFAKPVLVNVLMNTHGSIYEEVVSNDINNLQPGSKINISLGFKLGSEKQESSPAFVRAKVTVTFDEIVDHNGDPIYFDQFVSGLDSIISPENNTNWVSQDFSSVQNGSDIWYVCREGDVAREVQNLETKSFLNGTILLSQHMTNITANKTMRVMFVVEAIQTANIINPLISPSNCIWTSYK